MEEWKQLAKKQRMSISRFVMWHVEDSVSKQRPEYTPSAKTQLMKELSNLKEEVGRLQSENRMLRMAYERVDSELKRKRAEPFLDEEFTGTRRYWQELIEVLRTNKYVSNDQLLGAVGVDPKDSEVVRAVRKQLENLIGYGLVEVTARGWRWKG